MQSLDSFVAVLLALKRFLAPPGYDAAAAAAEGAGEVAPKLATLGLVNPPAAAITAAVRGSLWFQNSTAANQEPLCF